mmetsp:Transcript_81848/g.175356  ORF Transcript_81848/g.175356 Transcript_81848/m.175356 type:complete len:220 (-) Transcript_81848:583-1242(-)
MEVHVAVLGHVVVDHDVYTLDIHATAEQVGRDQDAFLEILEGLQSVNTARVGAHHVSLPLLGVHGRRLVQRHRRETGFLKQAVEDYGAPHRLDKDDYLVEFQRVEQVYQFLILRLLVKLNVILKKSMESELLLRLHSDLVRTVHELLADSARLRTHRRTKHHHLLLLRCLNKDLLHVPPHVECVNTPVALVQDKVLQGVQLEGAIFLAKKLEHPPGRSH